MSRSTKSGSGPQHPLQKWPVIPLALEVVPSILPGDPEVFVRLQIQTHDILTAHDGQVYRTVASPHRDSSHFAMSLDEFRKLAEEIEGLARRSEGTDPT